MSLTELFSIGEPDRRAAPNIRGSIREYRPTGVISSAVAGTIEADRWYDVKIQVEGRQVHCYLDGKEIHNVQVPNSFGPSVYGQAGRTAGGEIVVRLVNVSPVKQRSIDLEGAGTRRYSAVVPRLTSRDLDGENSLSDPISIHPIESQMRNIGSKFRYEPEGNSFAVLRLVIDRN